MGRGAADPVLGDGRGRAGAVSGSAPLSGFRPCGRSYSLWSEDSFCSIVSKGSAFSVASVGSFASIGSIGSAGSALSIGSAGSAGSVMSAGSLGSVLSAGARDAILGDEGRGDAALLSAAVLAGCAAAIAGWALYRR